MDWTCDSHGEDTKFIENFDGKAFAKCPLERPGTEECINPMDPRETGCDG